MKMACLPDRTTGPSASLVNEVLVVRARRLAMTVLCGLLGGVRRPEVDVTYSQLRSLSSWLSLKFKIQIMHKNYNKK